MKRFIPSEFGSDTSDQKVVDFVPIFQGKVDVVKYLISKESSISWTAIISGPFFDWGLKVGFLGLDLANKKAELFDGGDVVFSATNTSTIGKAVVATLSDKAYEKTKNQHVRIASHAASQNDILASIQRNTGGQKWETTVIDTDALTKSAYEKLAKQDFSGAYDLIKVATAGKVALGKFDSDWNEELGLPKETLDESVKAAL